MKYFIMIESCLIKIIIFDLEQKKIMFQIGTIKRYSLKPILNCIPWLWLNLGIALGNKK